MTEHAQPAVTLADIEAARDVLTGISIRTPMERSRWLSASAGGDVHLKCENLQRTGSFKIRGAYVRISRLSDEERARGVVAASAGNHAQGVALPASCSASRPRSSCPRAPRCRSCCATAGYGAEVALRTATYRRRGAASAARASPSETGAVLIHPFDHPDIVAGQGTLGLEILEQSPDVTTIVVPHRRRRADRRRRHRGQGRCGRDVRIIGVQADECRRVSGLARRRAPGAARARCATIADGIAVGMPGDPPLRDHPATRRRASSRSPRTTVAGALLVLARARQAGRRARRRRRCRRRCSTGRDSGSTGPTVIVLSRRQHRPAAAASASSATGSPPPAGTCSLRIPLPDRPGQLAGCSPSSCRGGRQRHRGAAHPARPAACRSARSSSSCSSRRAATEHCEQVLAQAARGAATDGRSSVEADSAYDAR